MKSTFWMTAQEAEDELNRRKINIPNETKTDEQTDLTSNLLDALARYKAIRPELTDEEKAAFVDGFHQAWHRGYAAGIQDEKRYQKNWA